jgi:hypothetical protein
VIVVGSRVSKLRRVRLSPGIELQSGSSGFILFHFLAVASFSTKTTVAPYTKLARMFAEYLMQEASSVRRLEVVLAFLP